MTGPTSGTRPDEIRRHNRTALLRRLHVDGPSTRASLAAELGLNRSTIKALVDGLAEAGVVAERVPALRSGAGRPSLLVLPQPNAAVVIAIDVRVEHVAMGFVGLGGEILGRDSWNLHRTRDPGEVITHIVESARLMADDLDATAVGVGVSVPGVVRRADGHVHEAPNLHWSGVALGKRLEAVLKLPVQVGNDAELGALAEHVRGAAQESSDMVYISADVGVGGGVILSGQPLRGTGGYVGELGHMVVNPRGGRSCYCGCVGCWETEVGEPALCRALGLPDDAPRGAVVAALRALDDPSVLDEFADWLALGLANIVNVLGPELVVLGDLYTALPASVVDSVSAAVQRRSLVSRAVGGTQVVTSPLGRDAKLVGAAELAFEPVLDTL
ncbi:ROK family transcriptional regulator [Lentzea aerocolonigenes]|uniref:ROK family transcriptional regulator n=1 Tax=Lentzea aerocolonigenes TaxID=68170 RepID=UPI0004C31644|nr:ROK family transcriptional regulator [Lentzea aerocolonigenes]MCP2243169.1 Sugar kinase of the NBD/HSP70 family, may containing an N-terminal HTH domain [Lentzea aerocolonigenes]